MMPVPDMGGGWVLLAIIGWVLTVVMVLGIFAVVISLIRWIRRRRRPSEHDDAAGTDGAEPSERP